MPLMNLSFITVRTEKARHERMYCVPLFRWSCGRDETKKWWNQRVVSGRRETSGWKGAWSNVLLRLRTVCDLTGTWVSGCVHFCGICTWNDRGEGVPDILSDPLHLIPRDRISP